MNKPQYESISKWQRETFGHATPASKAHHLVEEVRELMNEVTQSHINRANVASELADCFILLIGIANSSEFSYRDVCRAISDKMRVNKARKWGKPDENGVVNHVK